MSKLSLFSVLGLVLFAGAARADVYTYGDVFGAVVDSKGAAVAGAEIQLTHVDHGMAISDLLTTDAKGAFTGKDLIASKYAIMVRAAGYADFGPLSAEISEKLPLKVSVTLKTLQETADEAPGMTVVRWGSISGTVTDAAGKPVADATVEVTRRSAGGMATSQVAFTGADGKFTIEQVFATTYEIVVRAAGYKDSGATPASVSDGKSTAVAVVVFTN